jgi:hypothetical protein
MNIHGVQTIKKAGERLTLRRLTYTAFIQFIRLISPLPSANARHANRLAFRAAIKSLRRELRLVSGQALRLLTNRNSSCSQLDPTEIRSVLICRVNGRLGNTLLLTPLIKRIHDALPNVDIDLALAYPKAQELLQGVPGIRRVIIFPHKSPNAVWRYLAAVHRLRAQRYDLAIDPTPDSTSGRVAVALARTRYRLGFDTISQWVPLTHPVVLPDESMHDAIRPVYLLCEGLGVQLDADDLRLWLPLLDHELDAGRSAVAKVVSTADAAHPRSRVFGFFAHAAGIKIIDRAWWLAFWEAFSTLEPDAIPVEFLSLSSGTCIDPRFPSLSFKSPRAFAAAIAATRMFIAPDTGPMHLASSTPVPTVGLFCGSDMLRYRPMKSSDVTIDVTLSSPRSIAERCSRGWREQQRA